jgi:hypothetical protein
VAELELNYSGDLSVLFENRGRFGQPIYIDNIRLESTTGIEKKQDTELRATAFPNPTYGDVNVVVANMEGPVQLSIQDMFGRTILSEKYNSDAKIKLSFAQFASGVYSISVRNNNRSAVLKVVKQ